MAQKFFLFKVISKALNSGKNSWDGFMFLLKSEMASRIEVYGFIWTLGIFWVIGASLSSAFIALILFLLLLSAEALNTAVEVIIDRISPEISDVGKQAKDLGSFAVFCLLVINFMYFIFVVVTSPRIIALVS
jgi:diacylglycerol kinase